MRKSTTVNLGDIYGRLTITSSPFYKVFPSGSKAKFVECICSCGEIRTIRLGSLTTKTNPTRSCGCLQQEAIKNLRVILVEGEKFSRLTVVKDLGMKSLTGQPKNFVLVVCECGSPPFETRVDGLKDGNTKSCGCLQKETVRSITITHGMSNTSAYGSWQKLRYRCDSPKDPRWERYGGRGITYPENWSTFETFWEDMSDGWFEGADIDRINFDLSYSKDNCRWVNRDIGNHNKSKPEDCTSIYKGVYYDKARDKWVARLNRNGIIHLQKRFNTEIEAAFAYDEVSEAIYGDRPNKTIAGIFP